MRKKELWLHEDMLNDALESQDLDENVYDKSTFYNHPILQHFESLGQRAVKACVYLILYCFIYCFIFLINEK